MRERPARGATAVQPHGLHTSLRATPADAGTSFRTTGARGAAAKGRRERPPAGRSYWPVLTTVGSLISMRVPDVAA